MNASSRARRLVLIATTVFAALTSALAAQAITGNILGTVRDATGSTIPGVGVIMTHLETNRVVTAITDYRGEYISAPLSVGHYRVEAELPGFKRAVRPNVTLQLQQQLRIDITLEVGDISEAVEVIGTTPLLETTTSTVGRVVDNRQILELPLDTRNIYQLVFLTPGITGSTTVDHSPGADFGAYGTRTGWTDIQIDGVTATHPTATGKSGISVFPSVDAVQEFKVLGSTFAAEHGRSQGTVINIVYKSGTNDFHGSAYNFHRNSVLDANDFFANARGEDLASFKRNQFGATLGGPVQRDKMWFMFSFEGLRQRSLSSSTYTVPTARQRQGDFSQTFDAQGRLVQIYNPFTTRPNPDGEGFIRDPFPGNVIPQDFFDPVAVNVMQFYPMPNQPGHPITERDNFYGSGSDLTDVDNWDIKIDRRLTEAQEIFVRYSRGSNVTGPPTLFPQDIAVAEGTVFRENHPRNVVVSYSNTLTPTTVVTGRLGFSRTLFLFNNQGLGFRPSQLGLPTEIDTFASPNLFPNFTASGYKSLGTQDHRRTGFNTYSTMVSVSHLRDAHNLKFGFEGRMIRVNLWEARSPSGRFDFTAAMTQGPDPFRAGADRGNSIASLLLGTGAPGARLFDHYKNVAAQSFYLAGYIQDDWRLTPNLTLNLGLRYDVETPRTERFDRLNWFDPDLPSPLADVVPGFPDLRGGMEFVGVDGNPRRQFPTDKYNFAPRLGVAYQLNSLTVLRAGYAHMYGPSLKAASGTDTPWGFRGETEWLSTVDGITPHYLLSNPYADGLFPYVGSARGLLSGVGEGFRPSLQTDKHPWSQQMSVTIQRELPADLMVEVGYIGTRGRELELTVELNQLPIEYLALGSSLAQLVDNPFFGVVEDPRGFFLVERVAYGQLLRPFPHFGDIRGGGRNSHPDSRSWYNAFQLALTKRMSHGLQFDGSYVFSKNIQQGEGSNYQDFYNLRASRSLAGNDIRHRIVVSHLYELPFGRGRRFGGDASGIIQAIIGGWNINGITMIQSGVPLAISASNTAGIYTVRTYPNNSGQSGQLDAPARERLDRWFDTSVFSQPAPFTLGNMGHRVSDIRNHGMYNFDLALFKEFHTTERIKVQFRMEALNAFNTVQFSSPNTSVTSGSFGRITSQANAPRQIQFGLKVLW